MSSDWLAGCKAITRNQSTCPEIQSMGINVLYKIIMGRSLRTTMEVASIYASINFYGSHKSPSSLGPTSRNYLLIAMKISIIETVKKFKHTKRFCSSFIWYLHTHYTLLSSVRHTKNSTERSTNKWSEKQTKFTHLIYIFFVNEKKPEKKENHEQKQWMCQVEDETQKMIW